MMAGAWSNHFEVTLGPEEGRLRLRTPVATPVGWLERLDLVFPLEAPEPLEEGLDTLRHIRGVLRMARVSLGLDALRAWARRAGVLWEPEPGEGLQRGRISLEGVGPLEARSIVLSGCWAVDGEDLCLGVPVVEGAGSVRDGWAVARLAMGRLGARWDAASASWRWPGAAGWGLRRVLAPLGMRLPRQVRWSAPPRLRGGRVECAWGGGGREVPSSWHRLAGFYEALERGALAEARRLLEATSGLGSLEEGTLRRLYRLCDMRPGSSSAPNEV